MPNKYQIAVFICNISDPEDAINNLKNYQRIYCGSEFCQYKLILNDKNFKKIAEIKPISLVLPAVITRPHFKKIERLINSIAAIQKGFELVINNFGVLQWYAQKKRQFPAVFGRVLCHYHLSEVFHKRILDKRKSDYFIKQYNVNRFEVSCLPSSYKYVLPDNVHISLYFPYLPVTISRHCFFRSKEATVDTICSQSCGHQHLELDHPSTLEKFVMIHNGYMYQCNITKTSDMRIPKIDRYVRQIITKDGEGRSYSYLY